MIDLGLEPSSFNYKSTTYSTQVVFILFKNITKSETFYQEIVNITPMYKTSKFRPALVKQGPEPGLLWPWGNLCKILPPAFCCHSFDFQNTQCANTAHAGCCRDRTIVLVLKVMELTLLCNHMGVILVDYRAPQNTSFTLKFYFTWKEKFLMLKQQRLLVGRNDYFRWHTWEVVSCSWKNTILRAWSLESSEALSLILLAIRS